MTITKTMAVEQLTCRDLRAYLLATLFVAGNIVLPQLCHLVPGGGLRWLPIYFFTLVAAYRYGIVTGLLTAVCSPLINNMLFGMPPTPMLPVILTKSVLLALTASAVAAKTGKVKLWAVVLTVATYQLLGSLAEWAITGSTAAALQDVMTGWPGMMVQVLAGTALLKLQEKDS